MGLDHPLRRDHRGGRPRKPPLHHLVSLHQVRTSFFFNLCQLFKITKAYVSLRNVGLDCFVRTPYNARSIIGAARAY